MPNQIGIEGYVGCPGCGFKDTVEDYEETDPGKSFEWRCRICGKVFKIKWVIKHVFYVVEEDDDKEKAV